jgi:hypothetical protein
MEVKAEIKKVVLKVSDKEISLSVDEAKKLKELLNELFGKEIVKEYIPISQPYPVYPPWRWNYPEVTWHGTNQYDNKQLVQYQQSDCSINCSL